jgi:hypothetical protein
VSIAAIRGGFTIFCACIRESAAAMSARPRPLRTDRGFPGRASPTRAGAGIRARATSDHRVLDFSSTTGLTVGRGETIPCARRTERGGGEEIAPLSASLTSTVTRRESSRTSPIQRSDQSVNVWAVLISHDSFVHRSRKIVSAWSHRSRALRHSPRTVLASPAIIAASASPCRCSMRLASSSATVRSHVTRARGGASRILSEDERRRGPQPQYWTHLQFQFSPESRA